MGRQSEFTREEKIAAVKLVEEGGRSVLSVANEYGIHENTLYKWKRQYSINPEGAYTGEPTVDGTEAENERLKRRVRELENEVDFLKKVSAYFAKGPK
jgi:transposase